MATSKIEPASPRTWLVVAAEERELEFLFGGEKRERASVAARFACELGARGDRWILVANGPGKLAVEALEKRIEVNGIISTGFCGALDPELRVGDIVEQVASIDRVAVTAAEKRALREKTGARAVDMESAGLERKAAEWGVAFRVIRAISDTAEEDMPLDFNFYRDGEGRFSRVRIALAALARPLRRVPALLRLDRNTKIAARRLGEYFADCEL
ncbi:MAG TPA: hypothetical protein VKS01_00105 [Bryobacteraceae bacterium]|nr:hypothetical protein [Bryobacteraceae bacterium]